MHDKVLCRYASSISAEGKLGNEILDFADSHAGKGYMFDPHVLKSLPYPEHYLSKIFRFRSYYGVGELDIMLLLELN